MTNDLLEWYGDLRLLQTNLGRILPQDGSDRVDFGFAAKRSSTGQHLVKNCPYAEDVATMIHRLAPQLLGRHISDGADYGATLGYSGELFDGSAGFLGRGLQLGHAEVENFDPAVSSHKQVLGLEVAMNDATIVRRDQALYDLEGIVDGLPDGQCDLRRVAAGEFYLPATRRQCKEIPRRDRRHRRRQYWDD